MLTAILGVSGFFVVIIVIAAIAGSGNHTVTTGQAGSTPSSAPAASKAATSTARVGSVITLTGNSSGEKMAVAVTKIISHAQPADQFSTPDPGKRFYAVQFRLDDTGTAAYSDSPSNGAAVVDSAGQSYQSTVYDVAGCESFPGTENIAAGDKGLGCIVFQVPEGAKITKVQFTLDSGFGPQTASGPWAAKHPQHGNAPSALTGWRGARLPGDERPTAGHHPDQPLIAEPVERLGDRRAGQP